MIKKANILGIEFSHKEDRKFLPETGIYTTTIDDRIDIKIFVFGNACGTYFSEHYKNHSPTSLKTNTLAENHIYGRNIEFSLLKAYKSYKKKFPNDTAVIDYLKYIEDNFNIKDILE
jgi:hypothetical protein